MKAEIGTEKWERESERLRLAFERGEALIEAQKVNDGLGFDASLPPDPYNRDSVNQVIRMGLASSPEEAMYLLHRVKEHLKILDHLDSSLDDL